MNLQDYFPYDSTIVGLNGIYHEVGEESFYVNSPCIMSEGQVITKGQTYLMIGTPMECTAELRVVILMDVFYQDGFINLVILDKKTHNASTIGHFINSDEQFVEWKIIDVNYFIKNVLNEYGNKK
jgi:hypothetical protein